MKRVRIAETVFLISVADNVTTRCADSGIELDVFPESMASDQSLDILQLDAFRTIEKIRDGELHALGRLAFRDGIDLDEFPQALIDRFRASDVVYAIPCEMDFFVLLYRRDLLDKHGFEPPRSWFELEQMVRTVVSVPNEIIGFAGVGVAGYAENFHFLGESLFPSWGWRWRQRETRAPRIECVECVEALTWFVELLRVGGGARAELVSRDGARRLFQDGKALFLVDTLGDWNCARMTEMKLRPDQIGVAMVPSGPSGRPEPGMSATALSIPTASARVGEAWEVIKILISPWIATENESSERGLVRARNVGVVKSEFAGSDMTEVLTRSRSYARINRPMIAGSEVFGDIVGAAAESAIAGWQPPAEALRVAQAMIDQMQWGS